MKRRILSIFIALILLAMPLVASPAMAATTQDVTVTFTPSFLSFSNSPTTWNIGSVSTSTNYTTGTDYFTIVNTSSVSANITISTVNATWTGVGVASTHSDTATAGADTVGMTASAGTGAYDTIVKSAAVWNKLWTDLGAGVGDDWELKFVSATSYTDGNNKGNAIRLTISSP